MAEGNAGNNLEAQSKTSASISSADGSTLPPPRHACVNGVRPGHSSSALLANAIYSARALAALLGVSTKTIGRLEKTRQLPPGFQLGGRRYWLGHILIEHFNRLQATALEEARLL